MRKNLPSRTFLVTPKGNLSYDVLAISDPQLIFTFIFNSVRKCTCGDFKPIVRDLIASKRLAGDRSGRQQRARTAYIAVLPRSRLNP